MVESYRDGPYWCAYGTEHAFFAQARTESDLKRRAHESALLHLTKLSGRPVRLGLHVVGVGAETPSGLMSTQYTSRSGPAGIIGYLRRFGWMPVTQQKDPVYLEKQRNLLIPIEVGETETAVRQWSPAAITVPRVGTVAPSLERLIINCAQRGGALAPYSDDD